MKKDDGMAVIDENGELIIPVTGSDNAQLYDGKKESKSSEPVVNGESPSGNKGSEPLSGDETGKDGDTTGLVEQLQRLQAEFSNYKRRVEKERESMARFAKSEMASKLLTILDDLERMIDHHQGEGGCSLDGVKLIYSNMKKVLMEEGLEDIPALGEVFNPEVHEAVGVEVTDEDRDGLVVDEWMKGYRFAGRMLRPSRVKVGKHEERT